MNKDPTENEFIALEIPESAPFKEEQSGGLNFIQSNYDFNNTKSSDNSNSSINFGDMGKSAFVCFIHMRNSKFFQN
jgi:hypothetical protein